jgi:uncharacterized protein (TIGR02246 family)
MTLFPFPFIEYDVKRLTIYMAAVLASGVLVGWLSTHIGGPAAQAQQNPADPAAPGAAQPPAKAEAEAGIKVSTAEYVKAFNAADAKAVSALWTEGGEFTDIDGSVVRGRADLEKMYAETFKTSPKGKLEIQVESVRTLGKTLATSEGFIRFIPADGKEPEVTRYTALHAREGDGWLTASAREWVPDPAELVKLSDLDWLIGDWEAKRDDREVRTTYTWGDEKAFIQCRFKVTEKGQVVASGTEMIAKDPKTGQIRSWLFDRSGTLAEAAWTRDGKRWLVEIAGTTPDGSELSAVNSLVPSGKDAFTWVSVDRSVAGQPLPNVAPLKVTRVKK